MKIKSWSIPIPLGRYFNGGKKNILFGKVQDGWKSGNVWWSKKQSNRLIFLIKKKYMFVKK
jgi:hypothetical protein